MNLILSSILILVSLAFLRLNQLVNWKVITRFKQFLNREQLPFKPDEEIHQPLLKIRFPNEDNDLFNEFKKNENIKFSSLFPSNEEYYGKDLFRFLDDWLTLVSAQKKMSFSISTNDEFLQTKFKHRQIIRTLQCIKTTVDCDTKNIDIKIFFSEGKIVLECFNILKLGKKEHSNFVIKF